MLGILAKQSCRPYIRCYPGQSSNNSAILFWPSRGSWGTLVTTAVCAEISGAHQEATDIGTVRLFWYAYHGRSLYV